MVTQEHAQVRSGAALNRHRSKQDIATPWELIGAVERRFGPITWDLAATADNAKSSRFITPEQDSFRVDWYELNAPGVQWHAPNALLWLNPPFDPIAPWAEKCAWEVCFGARIAMLAPAAVGTVWFREHVHGRALVLPLSPRVTFVGSTDPYPKDLMLCVYGEPPGFERWRWRDG